ncbi:leucine-rich repeat domain-containing protein [Candidatus Odyssella thessalonicensis]|uniref:leucine-rich repeat domain-containing protein n=1 Tax=Candidatus Odyssella thessalonicensis TaxID=84647 RepID=UPI000225AEC1|nr:leucine-rich repeat domain-containing protein [Candidatus Odyssella thessalonicensis]
MNSSGMEASLDESSSLTATHFCYLGDRVPPELFTEIISNLSFEDAAMMAQVDSTHYEAVSELYFEKLEAAIYTAIQQAISHNIWKDLLSGTERDVSLHSLLCHNSANLENLILKEVYAGGFRDKGASLIHIVQSIKEVIANPYNLDLLLTIFSTSSSVENFSYRDKPITYLPCSIKKLTALKHLELCNTSLSSLPSAIGDLINLTELNLAKSRLSSLPAAIGNLSRLTQLSLAHNQLLCLPASISNLTQLKFFNTGNNPLCKLPRSIINLLEYRNFVQVYLGETQLPPQLKNPIYLKYVPQIISFLEGEGKDILDGDGRSGPRAPEASTIEDQYLGLPNLVDDDL